MARGVRPLCFRMVSRIPQNGFVRPVLAPICVSVGEIRAEIPVAVSRMMADASVRMLGRATVCAMAQIGPRARQGGDRVAARPCRAPVRYGRPDARGGERFELKFRPK